MQPVPEPLFLALDFYHDPRRFEQLRQPYGPLPPGMGELLAAPGGCLSDEQVEATANVLGDTPENCREAVLFFIKQVLFEVPGDHYRVLGVNRDAEPAQIKEHYFHLMRLFHPDRDTEGDGWDDVYAPRINEAYNVLRNAGKRAAYDAQLAPPAPPEQQPVGAATAAIKATQEPAPLTKPVPAATAAMHSPPTPAPTTTALWRKPWLYAALVVFLVGLLFVVLFQSSQAPRLTVAAVATADGPDTGGGEQEAGEELAVAAAAAETGLDAAPTGSSGTVYGSPESDAEIEARVQARVAQATRAVLGAPRQIAAVAAPTETVADAVLEPDAEPDPVGAATAAKNSAQEIAVDVGQGQIAAVAAPTEAAPTGVAEVAPAPAAVPQPDAAPDPVGAATAAKNPAQKIAAVDAQDQIAAVAAPTVAAPTVAAPTGVAEAAPEPAAAPQPDAAPDPVGAATAAIEPAAAPAPITDAELEDLLLAFTYHYEFRDAAAFAALFAPDARTTDASGRTNIRDLYAGFFADNEVQGVRFSKVRWRSGELLRSGSARVRITTAPIAGGDASTVEAQIHFDVGRADSGDLLITRMTY
ncbi:J domain-containing protein [Pseudohalioglobus sediminis]|uniref:J domain-containing protein n=1 Tax=Pseudohalioglobus sediminis TaxID=2606449 RepID=A0A5B0WQQ1_9GAMM|nr:J domain-containing protein [Pseudohalioglobus sediminis]KAA1188917.1 J domain-containing protein [Pseudohalioglobus sediminis]